MTEQSIEILKKMLPVNQSVQKKNKCITTNLGIKTIETKIDDAKRRNTYQFSNLSELSMLKIMSENIYETKGIKLSFEGSSEDCSETDVELKLHNRNFKVNTGTLKRIGTEVKHKYSSHSVISDDSKEGTSECLDLNVKSKSSSTNEIYDLDILGDLLGKYYYDISENSADNFENYVVNNLTLISYLHEIIPKGELTPTICKEKQMILKEFDSNKKVLILDLDETLIHSDFENECMAYDAEIEIPVDKSSKCALKIVVRPHLNEFLQFVKSKFNIVLFTAGIQDYADPIINYIDPLNEIFKLRLYRDSCYEFRNFFIKDLRILLGIQDKDMIIVDNCIFSFALNLSNGYLISSFYENNLDTDLLNLKDYLEKLIEADDVREVNENYYGLETLKAIMYDKLLSEGILSKK